MKLESEQRGMPEDIERYLRQLAIRAYELFESSEPQEKRLLLKETLQNLVLVGSLVRYNEITL